MNRSAMALTRSNSLAMTVGMGACPMPYREGGVNRSGA
jgi:hypothetical protein